MSRRSPTMGRRQRELGLRSVDIARSLGSTDATVSRWVNGRSTPGPKNLQRLAEILRLPQGKLVKFAGMQARCGVGGRSTKLPVPS